MTIPGEQSSFLHIGIVIPIALGCELGWQVQDKDKLLGKIIVL